MLYEIPDNMIVMKCSINNKCFIQKIVCKFLLKAKASTIIYSFNKNYSLKKKIMIMVVSR